MQIAFKSISRLMERLSQHKVDMVRECGSLLSNRPRLLLENGYNRFSTNFGIATPAGSRVELRSADEGVVFLEIRGAEWLTFEFGLPRGLQFTDAILEGLVLSREAVVCDVFFRTANSQQGHIDSEGKLWALNTNEMASLSFQQSELPELAENVDNRLIIHVRMPPENLAFRICSVFFLA